MKAHFIIVLILVILTVFEATKNPSYAECTPILITPSDGAELDNGCSHGSDLVTWQFDWQDCEGATRYQLYVKGAAATYPVIDIDDIINSEYTNSSYGYILDRNRFDWIWKVRAMVDGVWGPWSEEWTFDVELLDTDCASICRPGLLSPINGAELDNGCSFYSDTITWEFDWEDCPDATKYHLYITDQYEKWPLVDNDSISNSYFVYAEIAYLPAQGLSGWTWKVKAMVNGVWGLWSEKRNFDVEPLNTDCITAINSSNSNNSQIIIYPNPIQDIVILELNDGFNTEELEIHLYSLTGLEMIKKSKVFIKQNSIEVDLKGIPAGLYIMLIENENSLYKYKLTKL